MTSAAHARNLLGPVLRGAYRVRVTGAHRCLMPGGVILAALGRGRADPAVLAVSSPRPVHVIVDAAEGIPPQVSGWMGRLVVERAADAPRVLRRALDLVAEGRAVGVFVSRMGEHHPNGNAEGSHSAATAATAAWLQYRSGAPVIPVAIEGTSVPAGRTLPRWRSTVHLGFGEAIAAPRRVEVYSRDEIRQRGEVLRQAVEDFTREADARWAPGGVEWSTSSQDNGGS